MHIELSVNLDKLRRFLIQNKSEISIYQQRTEFFLKKKKNIIFQTFRFI